MKRLIPLLLPLLLCGFFGDGDEPKKPLPQVDTTDDTIKSYTGGKTLAPYKIALHDGPKAGQYWEVGSDSYDIDSTSR